MYMDKKRRKNLFNDEMLKKTNNKRIEEIEELLKEMNKNIKDIKINKKEDDKLKINNFKTSDDLIKSLSKKSLNKDGKRNIKESSIKQYLKKIEFLYKQIYNKNFTPDDLYLLKNTDKFINHIKNKYGSSSSSSLSYFIAITSIINRLDGYEEEYKIYNNVMMTYYNKNIKKIGENKLTEREEKNYLDWDEILKINNFSDLEEKVIFCLYTCIPPRRNDYRFMKIKRGVVDVDKLDKEYNYYLVDMDKLIFKNYKTNYIYNDQIINLNSENTDILKYSQLKKILKEYTKDMKDGELLFTNNKKEIIKNFTLKIQKSIQVEGKRLTANLLRHSFITWLMNKKLTKNELDEISYMMGHNLNQQISYRKFNNTDDLKIKFE